MAEFTERVKLLIETVTDKATGDLSGLEDEGRGGGRSGFGKLKTTAAWASGRRSPPPSPRASPGWRGSPSRPSTWPTAFEKAHAQLENVTANVGQNFEELTGSVDRDGQGDGAASASPLPTPKNAMARLTVATKDRAQVRGVDGPGGRHRPCPPHQPLVEPPTSW
jgi:hypothetical protein